MESDKTKIVLLIVTIITLFIYMMVSSKGKEVNQDINLEHGCTITTVDNGKSTLVIYQDVVGSEVDSVRVYTQVDKESAIRIYKNWCKNRH